VFSFIPLHTLSSTQTFPPFQVDSLNDPTSSIVLPFGGIPLYKILFAQTSSLFCTQDAFNFTCEPMFNDVKSQAINLFSIFLFLVFVKSLQFRHIEGEMHHKHYWQQQGVNV
jgi:hypothetical protein